MNNISMINEPVAINSTAVAYSPTGMTALDTFNAILESPTIFYAGDTYALPIRDLDGNVNNMTLFTHSIRSDVREKHRHLGKYKSTHVPTSFGNYNVFRTSNNLYFFDKRDKNNIASWEDSDRNIYGWREVTEVNNATRYSQEKKFHGIVVGSHEEIVDAQLNKFVTAYAYDGPNNSIGTAFSMAWNLRQIREKYAESKESNDFAEFLESIGYERPAKEKGYVVGAVREGAAAAVKGPFFYVSQNFSNIVKSWARSYDVPEEVMEAYILAFHEPAHLGGIPGGVSGESKLEAVIATFMEELADQEQSGMPHNTAYRGSKRTAYKQIAAIARRREEQVVRNYAGRDKNASMKEEKDLEEALEENDMEEREEELTSILDDKKMDYVEREETGSYDSQYSEFDSIERVYEKSDGEAVAETDAKPDSGAEASQDAETGSAESE